MLLDVSPGSTAEFDRTTLQKIGHPVLMCHGPVEKPCPLLEGRGCPKFDQAHGIVFMLDLDSEQHRAILRRYRQLARDDLPIRVVVTSEQAECYREQLSDFEVWAHDPTVADLDGFAARVESTVRFAAPNAR